jgi:hypothetical protein
VPLTCEPERRFELRDLRITRSVDRLPLRAAWSPSVPLRPGHVRAIQGVRDFPEPTGLVGTQLLGQISQS